ncbi:hypothetical protein [Neobacillus bataviensis]|uniref:hypothetical protein n=1 Tax=Neobacillus bataviensis TaxID=220685 RepID=UPI001CBB13DB|nr:hypothetical protein [Neobacillus bataviensis]
MKKKIIVGAISGLLILGGAAFANASKNDTRADDSNHLDDSKSNVNTRVNGQKVEIETEHGKSYIKVKSDDRNGSQSTNNSVNDDNKTNDGAHQNRHSGEDDNKTVDGAHQNRHSGDDDLKTDDGTHQNRHSGDDDNKNDDGTHQNRHSGNDDQKSDDGEHQNRHSEDDDN